MLTTPAAMPFPVPPAVTRAVRFAEAALDTTHAAVGQTPKRVVWSRGPATLARYQARTDVQQPLPLLLVHSLVSRPYILDLVPGNSFVAYLLDQGFDVYLADWGIPTSGDADLGLEDYVLDFLPAMVDAVLEESAADALSLLGYCLGGVLTLLYAATHPDGPVRNLLTLATPVDFDHLGLLGVWGRALNADRLVDHTGNVPAALIKQSFRLLKPASEVSPVRLVSLWQQLEDNRFVAQFRAFDRWTNDHVDFPGAAFRQTLRELVQGNKLIRGGLTLDGIPVDLAAIRPSLLAIAAEGDHIVPVAAAAPQVDLVASQDKGFLRLPGGHVGLAAGRKARTTLWPHVAAWLAARSGDHAHRAAADEYGLAAD